MVKDKTIEIKNSGKGVKFIEVDGERYICDREKFKKIDGVEHSVSLVFKKFDVKEYTKCLNLIVKALEKRTTTKELLTQILKDIDMKTMRRLAKRIKDKKPIKKHSGCLGFKVGDAYVQLLE